MRKLLPILSMIFLRIIILAQIFFCYKFLNSTKGLLYFNDDGRYDYTSNLQSSGGEDEAALFYVMDFYILYFILSLIFWSKKAQLRLLIFTVIMHILSLGLIQIGSVYGTIAQDKNLWLLFIMINPVLMFVVLLYKNKPERTEVVDK
ncbi:MAG: hypothetical protein LBQ84_00085 [Flavobacteriaceae bacterium]|jgi:hypothetical protein|nr:hypothetical protein [Flavobacteriaceae bacterium]